MLTILLKKNSSVLMFTGFLIIIRGICSISVGTILKFAAFAELIAKESILQT